MKATVDQIVKEGQVVTIEAICRKSIEMDDQGRGVKKSAILENVEAHAYYREHSSSYQAMKQRNRKQRSKPAPVDPHHVVIDPSRDVDRVRYRYLQLTKSEIVERLLSVEQAYVEVQQQLARLQFQWIEQEDQRLKQPRTHDQILQKGEKMDSRDGIEKS